MVNPLASVKDGVLAFGGRVAELRATPEAKATGGAIWGALKGVKPAVLFGIGAALIFGAVAAVWVAIAVLGASSVRHAYTNGKPALDRQRKEARAANAQAQAAVEAEVSQPEMEAAPERAETPALSPGPRVSAELARRGQGVRQR